MSTSPPSPDSYVRRNLPPLIVGLAAIVAIVGALVVVIDRARDDNDDGATVADAPIESDARERQLDGEFGDLLEQLVGDQLLLGVSLSEELGVLRVQHVVPGTPAEAAGIEPGDEILGVDGARVSSVEELRAAIAAVEIGDEYEVEIARDGDNRELTVRREITIGAAMAALLERFAAEGFDLDRFDLDDFDSRAPNGRSPFASDPFAELRLRPTLGLSVVQTNEGLRVVRVEAHSIAEEAGFEPGDVILEANGEPVDSIEDLRAVLPTGGLNGGQLLESQVLELLVLRDGDELTLVARFPASLIPFFPVQPNPSLPNATPGPDLFAERFFGELDDLESFLDSDEFLDQVSERLRDRIEALIEEALTASAAESEPQTEDEPASFAGLDVYRGNVDALSDGEIVLGGSLGSIAFELTEETAIVGGMPRVGRVSTVASNADREALLVLTTN